MGEEGRLKVFSFPLFLYKMHIFTALSESEIKAQNKVVTVTTIVTHSRLP